MGIKKNKQLKLYHSIGEVAAELGLSETLLRFWEKEFPSLKPKKAGRGIRQYSASDIEEVRKIRHLVKEKGMTLEGARQVLKRTKGKMDMKLEVLSCLKSIREELLEIERESMNQ